MPNPQNKSILEKIFLDTNIEKSQSAPPITQSTIYITPGTAENDWVTVAGTTTELATLISTGPATTSSIAKGREWRRERPPFSPQNAASDKAKGRKLEN